MALEIRDQFFPQVALLRDIHIPKALHSRRDNLGNLKCRSLKKLNTADNYLDRRVNKQRNQIYLIEITLMKRCYFVTVL